MDIALADHTSIVTYTTRQYPDRTIYRDNFHVENSITSTDNIIILTVDLHSAYEMPTGPGGWDITSPEGWSGVYIENTQGNQPQKPHSII